MTKNRTTLFRRLDNALIDMQAATHQNFESIFRTFATLINDPSLEAINQHLTEGLDVDTFLQDSYKTAQGMVGSAKLLWPAETNKILGLRLSLIQKYTRYPDTLWKFAHTFFYVERGNSTAVYHNLNRQLFIPFVRDYKDHVIEVEGIELDEKKNITDTSSVGHFNIINISGSNARVNNHSVDNSINLQSNNETVFERIRELRQELAKAELSTEQKLEAEDLVNEIESQINSGQPNKTVVRALLGYLPKLESLTNIVKNLLDLF